MNENIEILEERFKEHVKILWFSEFLYQHGHPEIDEKMLKHLQLQKDLMELELKTLKGVI